MKLFQRLLSNLSLFFLVMLLFLLLFQNKVSLPPAVQVLGRMHPLLLHLPIGLFVLAFIFWLGKKMVEEESFRKLFALTLHIIAFTTTLTALMGFFLSKEGGYDENLLTRHKLPGIVLAVLSYIMLLLYRSNSIPKTFFSGVLILSLVIMIVGSHYGANLTHGEGFVWQPLQPEEETEEMITDSSSLFVAAIRPVLKSKCFSCHNEKKAKGGLVMTSEETILAGGKNGPIWKSGDALNSHIIQNINLPAEDKKHMPPKGKPQLTEDEIQLLFAWIQVGADMKKRLVEYSDADTLKMLAQKFIRLPVKETETQYPFAAASAATIQKLNGPFCSVFPLSQTSPALQADFFVREKFDRKRLEDLLKVKEQLVVLNLGNMPVTDEDMKIVGGFPNLEKLNLNHTLVSDNGMKELKKLTQLRSVSVAGTKVSKETAQVFAMMDSLKEVFVWNSGIGISDAAALQQQFSKINFNTGYVPDENEILSLTPPILVNEEFILQGDGKIELKHPVRDVQIRFTTDGSVPDSTSSPVYTGPVDAIGFMLIKARAVKPGWFSSPVAEFSFFKKGFKPSRAELINQPDEKYKAEGVTSLFDDKKGPAESFGDPAWLGFREKPFATVFYFDTAKPINSISISYLKNVQSYIVPPEEIEIWGGSDRGKLKFLKRVRPPQLNKDELNAVRAEGMRIEIPSSSLMCYKIVIKNVSKLPAWHPGKGDKGWVFIDEIFFN